MSNNLFVQEVQDPGVNKLTQAITSNQIKGTLASVEVVGVTNAQMPYVGVAKNLLDSDINLVGVIRNNTVHVQFDSLSLVQHDVLVYVCSTRTDWPSLRALIGL